MGDDRVFRQVTIMTSATMAGQLFELFLQQYEWADNMGGRPECVLQQETDKQIDYAIFTNGLSVDPTVSWVLIEAATVRFEPVIRHTNQTRVRLLPIASPSAVSILPAEVMATMIDAYGVYAINFVEGAIARVEAELQGLRNSKPSEPSKTTTKERRGRRGITTATEKAAAYLRWHNLPDDDRPLLEDWLESEFGVVNGVLKVSRRTFYGWQRYIKS
jgi:hypothetical protein